MGKLELQARVFQISAMALGLELSAIDPFCFLRILSVYGGEKLGLMHALEHWNCISCPGGFLVHAKSLCDSRLQRVSVALTQTEFDAVPNTEKTAADRVTHLRQDTSPQGV